MELYVQGKSKKAINERLANGERVSGTNFSMFGGGGHYVLNDLTTKTVIKIFEKTVQGSPYAKAYGTYDTSKKKII